MIPKVKICGLSRPEDMESVNDADADYAGFVFYKKSKRNVSFRNAGDLIRRLKPQIKSVAVCVSPDEEMIKNIRDIGFDILQIHGDIPRIALDAGGMPLWQAVNLADGQSEVPFLRHPSVCGYVIDGAKYGGGKTFGWESDAKQAEEVRKLFEEMAWVHGGQPLKQNGVCVETSGRKTVRILAGGLTIDNVTEGIRMFHPDIVDVSSGVETDGYKDREKIKTFIRKVRES